MKSEKIVATNDNKPHFSDILITQSLTFIFQALVCLDQHVNEKTTLRGFLKVHWSDFHLSSLGGVVITFPVIPVDTISP